MKKRIVVLVVALCFIAACSVGFAAEDGAGTSKNLEVLGETEGSDLTAYNNIADAIDQEAELISGEDDDDHESVYTVAFSVSSSDGTPIEGVTLSIDGQNKGISDAQGKICTTVPNGSYSYTLTKERHETAGGSFVVEDKDLELPVHVMVPLLRLTIQVTNGRIAVDGAKVVVGDKSLTTGRTGKVGFWLKEGDYSYSVSRESFDTQTGTIQLTKDVATSVVLKGGKKVTFSVNDEDGTPVKDAVIEMKGYQNIYTTANGTASTWVTQGNLHYSINHERYNAVSGEMNISEDTTHISHTMVKKRYLAIFTIQDENKQPLVGAKVIAAGQVLYSNSDGEVHIEGLLPQGYELTVGKEGYRSFAGEFFVDHQTARVTVVLAKITQKPTPTQPTTPKPQPKPPVTQPRPPTGVRPIPPITGGWAVTGNDSGGSKVENVQHQDKLEIAETEQNLKTPVVAIDKEKPEDQAQVDNKSIDRTGGRTRISVGFNLVDAEGEPLVEYLTELHSDPQIGITDEDGYIFYLDVEPGPHTLYLKESEDIVLAQKDFVIQAGNKTEHNISESGTDYFDINKSINAVTVDVVYKKGQLHLANIHEGWAPFYSEVLTEGQQDQSMELNKDLIFWLIVGLAALALVLVVLIAARRNVRKSSRKNDYLQGGFRS